MQALFRFLYEFEQSIVAMHPVRHETELVVMRRNAERLGISKFCRFAVLGHAILLCARCSQNATF